jgi:hypothetical protein
MSDRRRRLSALSWLIVAAVLVRAASGGGGGGFLYVAAVEPRASYVTGAVVLVLALALALGFAISRSVVLPRLSAVLSIPTVLYAGWWYVLDDHTSGLALGAASALAFGLAAAGLRRPFPEPQAGSNSRPDMNDRSPIAEGEDRASRRTSL